MPDVRDTPMTVEEYREKLVPSYQTITLALMGGHQEQIRTHDFNTEKVITKSDVLDARTVIPTVFNTEMTEVNHAKFYPVGESFAAVGMYLGLNINATQKKNRLSSHNAILRELSIAWDRSALVGEFGNKGLLKAYPDDPMRVTMQEATLPAKTATFDKRADAALQLGLDLKDAVNETTGSDNLSVVVYGKDLQGYLAKTNSATDVASLYDYLRKGFGAGKYVNIIEVPTLVLKGSELENENGLAVVANGTLGLDTTEWPDLDKVGNKEGPSGDFDWSRFKIGSVQFKTDIVGGIINQKIKFAS